MNNQRSAISANSENLQSCALLLCRHFNGMSVQYRFWLNACIKVTRHTLLTDLYTVWQFQRNNIFKEFLKPSLLIHTFSIMFGAVTEVEQTLASPKSHQSNIPIIFAKNTRTINKLHRTMPSKPNKLFWMTGIILCCWCLLR